MSVPFVRPTDFDIIAFIEDSIANTPGVWRVDLLLHTTLEEAQRMIPRVVGKPIPVADGIALRVYVQDFEWFAHFLAQIDCPVQVLHPPAARAALEQLAAKVTAMAASPVQAASTAEATPLQIQ